MASFAKTPHFNSFNFASVCSGTECTTLVVNALQACFRKHFGAFDVHYACGCESDKAKREFLTELTKPNCVFENTPVLTAQFATNAVTGEVEAPSCDVHGVFGGFPWGSHSL